MNERSKEQIIEKITEKEGTEQMRYALVAILMMISCKGEGDINE